MSNREIKDCVIAAGGKGTRLFSHNGGKPKALTRVMEREIIFDQIDKFINYGCERVHIFLGYKADEIRDAVASEFSNANVDIFYYTEMEALGSGGALLFHLDKLPEVFLFTYCDIYFDLDISRFVQHYFDSKSDVSLICHPNDHPQDSDLVVTNSGNRIVGLKAHPHVEDDFPGNLVNAAFYIMSKKSFARIRFNGFEDFAQVTIPKLIKDNNVTAYVTHELLKDMGTPERLKQVKLCISRRDQYEEKRVIFIDRDGTLNDIVQGEYITEPSQIKLIPVVAEALVALRKMGYLIVLITNQPVLARGDLDPNGLAKIHARLDWLLSLSGAYLDYKFVCPHHPDKGFPGEVESLKIDCCCRKPKTGLLEQAAKIIDINYAGSWMVGDNWRDIEAGNKFGVKTCLVSDTPNPAATLTTRSISMLVKALS